MGGFSLSVGPGWWASRNRPGTLLAAWTLVERDWGSAARRQAEASPGFRKLVKWRTGTEGRIAALAVPSVYNASDDANIRSVRTNRSHDRTPGAMVFDVGRGAARLRPRHLYRKLIPDPLMPSRSR